MKPELRLEDSITPLPRSVSVLLQLSLLWWLVGWPIEFHSCQTASVCSSAPGLSADDIHITIYLHHKETLV